MGNLAFCFSPKNRQHWKYTYTTDRQNLQTLTGFVLNEFQHWILFFLTNWHLTHLRIGKQFENLTLPFAMRSMQIAVRAVNLIWFGAQTLPISSTFSTPFPDLACRQLPFPSSPLTENLKQATLKTALNIHEYNSKILKIISNGKKG